MKRFSHYEISPEGWKSRAKQKREREKERKREDRRRNARREALPNELTPCERASGTA